MSNGQHVYTARSTTASAAIQKRKQFISNNAAGIHQLPSSPPPSNNSSQITLQLIQRNYKTASAAPHKTPSVPVNSTEAYGSQIPRTTAWRKMSDGVGFVVRVAPLLSLLFCEPGQQPESHTYIQHNVK
eukprot:scaffold8271_cov94-Skeletonema_menzelii.AAC.2